MKKVETTMDDDLRPEYDLGSLLVRKVGPKRMQFRGQMETQVATLKAHGIDLGTLAKDYDILILPENAEIDDELFDANDAVSLSKHLKKSGARCGNTLDIGVNCPTLDRRSNDLWLGLVWILGNAAWPFLVSVVANMFTDPVKSVFTEGKVHTKGKVHVKFRWRQKGGELEQLDWQGDGATLVEVLKILHKSSEKDAA